MSTTTILGFLFIVQVEYTSKTLFSLLRPLHTILSAAANAQGLYVLRGWVSGHLRVEQDERPNIKAA